MEEGFVKGQSDNLPKVDIFMVARYLSDNGITAEMQGKKLNKLGRENYGDEAIGYVQIKREDDVCTVKCRVTTDHHIRVKQYHCTLVCNEVDSQILSIDCKDCTVPCGSCEHSITFLMWLYRRTDEPAPALVKCYWKKSLFWDGRTSAKFIKAKYLGPEQPHQFYQHKIECNGNMFLEKVTEMLRESKARCQLAAYVNDTPEILYLSMHHIICNFLKETRNLDFQHFMAFCKTIFTKKRCEMVQIATKAQSESTLWYEMRYGRVTGSKAYDAAYCKTENATLVEQIFGANNLIKKKALEKEKAIKESLKGCVSSLKNIKIKQSGLVLSPDFPFFGATPDGITEDYVIEIKYPTKSLTSASYFEDGKIGKKYYAQIQSQMFVTKKKVGIFCVGEFDYESSGDFEIYEIPYDETYCDELLSKITMFWKENIYTKLINPET